MGDFFLRGETCPVSQRHCLRWHKRDLLLPALSPPKGLERLLLACKVCAKMLPSINGLGGGCGCVTCPVKRSVSLFSSWHRQPVAARLAPHPWGSGPHPSHWK